MLALVACMISSNPSCFHLSLVGLPRASYVKVSAGKQVDTLHLHFLLVTPVKIICQATGVAVFLAPLTQSSAQGYITSI